MARCTDTLTFLLAILPWFLILNDKTNVETPKPQTIITVTTSAITRVLLSGDVVQLLVSEVNVLFYVKFNKVLQKGKIN